MTFNHLSFHGGVAVRTHTLVTPARIWLGLALESLSDEQDGLETEERILLQRARTA